MFYTYEEAADLLHLSPNYVRKLCSTHKLGYVLKRRMVKTSDGRFYLRRKRMIPQGELIRYMAYRAAPQHIPPSPEVIGAGEANVRRREAFLKEFRHRSAVSERGHKTPTDGCS